MKTKSNQNKKVKTKQKQSKKVKTEQKQSQKGPQADPFKGERKGNIGGERQ